MKTPLKFIPGILILFSFLSGAYAQETAIIPAEFEKRLKQADVQLLDVRTSQEFNKGHINKSLQADWLQKEQFTDRVQHLRKDAPILVYCASGVRSAEAAKWLRSNGYSNVFELKGGIVQWKAEDKPIVEPKKTKQLSEREYQSIISGKEKVLIHFGADWCPPCVKMKPALNAFKNGAGKNLEIVKIDAGINTQVMKELEVSTLPTFIFYRNGKEQSRKEGVLSEEELGNLIQ
jgi:rhodanese-related sulfurtransferase